MKKYVDLFGEEREDIPVVRKGWCQVWKDKVNFRRTSNKNKNCGKCKFAERQHYHDRYYWKCKQMGFSRSSASDIRKCCLCDLWEERK